MLWHATIVRQNMMTASARQQTCFKWWLAQHWSRLIWKEIIFWTISHFEMQFITCCTMIALQIMLESFQATQEWLHTSSLRFYFTCNFEEQNIPFAPIFRHIRTRCAFVDTFEFVTNKALDVCIGMSMLFWRFLEISQVAFLLHGVVMRRLLRMQLFCHRWGIRGSQQCTVCRQYTTCVLRQLSESVSNLCLCFRTSALAASHQVQSVSVSVSSDKVTEQSSRCMLSVG